jgi:uncharacterized membrane protein
MIVLIGVCVGFLMGILTCKLIDILKENHELRKEKNSK